jgi:hypothetical protein
MLMLVSVTVLFQFELRESFFCAASTGMRRSGRELSGLHAR